MISRKNLGVTTAALVSSMIIALTATGSDYGPFGGNLGMRTSDFITLGVIANHFEYFENSIYSSIAERISQTIPFQVFISLALNSGINPNYLFLYFYFFNNLFMALAFFTLGYSVFRRITFSLFFLCFLLMSPISNFYDVRVISSNISLSLIILSIAFFIFGRPALSAALLGGTLLIHPSFGLYGFLLLLFCVIYSYIIKKKEIYNGAFIFIAVFLFIFIPFGFNIASNGEILSASTFDSEASRSFVEEINNLAFPLSRGFPHVLGYMMCFILALFLFSQIKLQHNQSRIFIIGTLIFAVFSYILQIASTSLFSFNEFSQLALNHRANYIALPICILAISASILTQKRSIMIFPWICFAFSYMFFKQSLFEIVGAPSRFEFLTRDDFIRADLISPLLCAISLVLLDKRRNYSYNFAVVFICTSTILICIFSAYAFHNLFYLGYALSVLTSVGLLASKKIFESRRENGWLSWTGFPESHLKAARFLTFPTILTITAAVVVSLRLPIVEPIQRWQNFAKGGLNDSWLQRFLEENTDMNDLIVLMPLRGDGLWLSPVPWRSAYVDSYEGHFLLYAPDHLEEFIDRMDAYAVDGVFTPQGEVDHSAWQDTTWIRQNLQRVTERYERDVWVLTFEKYTCEEDRILTKFVEADTGYLTQPVLIRSEDLASNCAVTSGLDH